MPFKTVSFQNLEASGDDLAETTTNRVPQYFYTDTVVRIRPEEFGKFFLNVLTLFFNVNPLFYDTPKCDVRGGPFEIDYLVQSMNQISNHLMSS